jgi:hypothetical protein
MSKYTLGDYTIKNWNSWDRVPRDPVTVGVMITQGIGYSAAAAGLAAGTIAAGFGTAVIGYLATTAITSWAISALTPKPDLGGLTSAGIMVNAREAAAAQDFVYGKVRKGGVVTFYEATGTDNTYLHQVIVLAGHEVNSIGDIYINDEVVSIDGNNLVTGDTWQNKIRIKKHDGSQTTADSDLVAETTVDSNFKGLGIAYLYVRYEYDQDVFANGVPLVTAVVEGKKVYDPRTATTSYSNNAALCIRDFLTSSYGLSDSAIDDISFASAANECDENVTLAGSGTEKRYTLNGIVKADRSLGDVLGDMVTACAGTLFWGSGYWKLKAGAYSSPVKTLTLDDLRGPINLQTRISMQDNFNTVRGTFNDAEQDWITADYPEITSATFKTEDNGEEALLDLQLPFTTSSATAQRLAKLTLYRGREQMTLSADFGLEAFQIEVGDIIAFTNSRYGFSAKEFEVIGWRFASDQDAGDLRVNLTLRETSQSAFDWNAEETDIVSNNSTLPTFTSVAAPTNLALSATAVINDDGITIPAIKASWDISPNAFVQYYEIQYKRLGGEEDYDSIADAHTESENWGSITVTPTQTAEDYGLTNEPILTPDAAFTSVFGSSNSFTIEPVLNGYDYQVKVRAISALGVRSPFATAQLASQGDTTPPTTPSNLSAVGGSKYITITWTNPADQDLSHIEVWENDSDNLNTASLVGESSSSNFMRPNLANNITRYYWVRAVDLSLNKSGFTSSVNATTLLVTPNDFNDAVNDLFSESGAYGIEPVSSLPASGAFDGKLVLLLSDITIYRWDDATSSWSTEVYTESSVSAGDVTFASFASGIEPISIVSSLPTVSGYTGPKVVLLTTDNKLYRLDSGAWTTAVPTTDITGTIGENLFSDDLRPVERVSSLPTTGLTQGRIVLLTTDNKLYRYTGNEWTSAVPSTDITGQVNSGQIADEAIIATKIGEDAVTNSKIATDAITADVIAANAITETKIASDAITAPKISAGAIITSKIAAGAVTADEITAGAITTSKIETGAVTAAEIAAGAIIAGKIAADAVTATEIAANTITSSEIAAGAITANEIAANTITAGRIASNTITANEIAANAITASEIATNAVTADAIAANAVSTSELAADSVTAGIIAAGAVSTSELAADAVTAEKIATDAVVADKIAANAITSIKIGTDQVIANKIAASSIIGSKIAAGAVTADKISVNELSAISADLGTISVDEAHIEDAAITSAKIASSIQSNNYSAGSAGWKIQKDGSAEFNGVVISRQLLVDSGTLNVGNVSITPVAFGFTQSLFQYVETTNVNISAWAGSQKTYLCNVGMTGTVSAPSSAVPNVYWGWTGEILPLTRWSGNQTLRLKLVFWTRNINGVTNLAANWKIYEVT